MDDPKHQAMPRHQRLIAQPALYLWQISIHLYCKGTEPHKNCVPSFAQGSYHTTLFRLHENSLNLTTKHLMRKQVKHMAVTDPTYKKNQI